MIVHFDQLVILGILSSSIHWLVARSEIARPLWSRARGWLEKLLRCPACSGFWLGGLITWGGVHPFGDALVTSAPWWMWIVKSQLAGLAAMFLTPVFEGVMVWGLNTSAIAEEMVVDVEARAGVIDPALTESGEVTPTERPRPTS